jgi:hypothetical protein
MRKSWVLSLVCILLLAGSVLAQEQKAAPEAMSMMPPQALSDDLLTWMVGEWEGWTTSPMGKSHDWQKIEWALDNQFIIMHYTAKTTEPNQEAMKAMAEAMKMSKEDMEKMQNMVYKGMGTMTLNPQNGELMAMWFDNMRGTYKGTGKREGNMFVTSWESPMGTETRTIEKAGEDKMVMTFKGKGPTGEDMEGRTELTRKKGAGKS